MDDEELDRELKRIQLAKARLDLEEALARRQRKTLAVGFAGAAASVTGNTLVGVGEFIRRWWLRGLTIAVGLVALVVFVSLGMHRYEEAQERRDRQSMFERGCRDLDQSRQSCRNRWEDVGGDVVERVCSFQDQAQACRDAGL